MRRIHSIAAPLFFVVSSVAWAAPKSVILDVPGMTCPTCPVTIKKALLRQPGVTAVTVHYQKKQLEVAYDDSKTNPTVITNSTASVGFPSQPAR